MHFRPDRIWKNIVKWRTEPPIGQHRQMSEEKRAERHLAENKELKD